MTTLKISLTSFSPVLLTIISKKLEMQIRFVELLDIKIASIRLPIHIRKYTVLRSPFIDKKSREQFEQRTHKLVIIIYSTKINSKLLDNLRNIIAENIVKYPGVSLKLTSVINENITNILSYK